LNTVVEEGFSLPVRVVTGCTKTTLEWATDSKIQIDAVRRVYSIVRYEEEISTLYRNSDTELCPVTLEIEDSNGVK
jgi:hypothetical protein